LGPGVRRARLEDAQITDVAPTILYLRDAPIPSDVDGRVLTDAFDPEVLSRGQRRGGASVNPSQEAEYSEEEAAEIHDRLKSLGYVE
jgi:hypothetical protein